MTTSLTSRRDLLRAGAAVTGVLVLGGVTFKMGEMALFPMAAAPLLVLSQREARTVLAVGEAMFPQGAMPIDPTQIGLVQQVDDILANALAPVAVAAFRSLIKAVEWGTFASVGTRFSALSVQERTEVLEIWSRPGVMLRRVALDALKMVMAMAYFRNQTVRDVMGYRMVCSGGPG